MKITIMCYARFRDVFGEESTIDVSDGATILDAVTALAIKGGDDAELVLSPDGTIRNYVMIVHQGSRVIPADAGTITLTDGESLTLFPPVSGG
ncbi:MAG: MoaD/ThiS family protein [Methanospirillum sp.]|uniref:MoaD/ThiS family protein n=1 Tax=Methanospirillum sp. TaxID=45200 RepID=UPI00237547CE|nr:MoaD/ThiS family protein [Methanospirillum sp.]MDD1730455.1 MoaD/ThiS family protein [Methanospirillum sp.]